MGIAGLSAGDYIPTSHSMQDSHRHGAGHGTSCQEGGRSLPLTGKEADECVESWIIRQRAARAAALAGAKVQAAASGKEPFDLTALEKRVDTTREGRVEPVNAGPGLMKCTTLSARTS